MLVKQHTNSQGQQVQVEVIPHIGEIGLKYGNHSKELCDAMAVLIERQANNVVDWEEIRAQKAKRELALKKLPAGVRPIGM